MGRGLFPRVRVPDEAVQGAGDVIELNYDHLICAVGTAARSGIVAGAKEYCT